MIQKVQMQLDKNVAAKTSNTYSTDSRASKKSSSSSAPITCVEHCIHKCNNKKIIKTLDNRFRSLKYYKKLKENKSAHKLSLYKFEIQSTRRRNYCDRLVNARNKITEKIEKTSTTPTTVVEQKPYLRLELSEVLNYIDYTRRLHSIAVKKLKHSLEELDKSLVDKCSSNYNLKKSIKHLIQKRLKFLAKCRFVMPVKEKIKTKRERELLTATITKERQIQMHKFVRMNKIESLAMIKSKQFQKK